MRKYLRQISGIIIATLLLVGMGWFGAGKAEAQENNSPPALFFSDLESGPKTGWGGSAIRGAVVTVWGKNFGSTRGTSYITVNGVQLTQDSDYAEWGVVVNNARGMQRITFWLNSNCQDGPGEITVTVNSITSNVLPFTVRDGTIYFVSQSDGNDTYNGLYERYIAGTIGPFASFYKAITKVVAGDIVYVRGGTFLGSGGTFDPIVTWRADIGAKSGTAANPIAYVAYPNEIVNIGDGIKYTGFYLQTAGGDLHYYTFAKFKFQIACMAIHLDRWDTNNYGRFIGNEVTGAGGCMEGNGFTLVNSHGWRVFGNIIHDNGGTKYAHAIYLGGYGPNTYDIEIAWNTINNQSEGRGIQLYGHTTTDYMTDIRIHDNLIYNIGRDGITMGGNDAGTPMLDKVEVYNNIIYNVGIDDNGSCLRLNETTGDFKIFHNTLYANSLRIDDYPIRFQGAESVMLKNNIFYQSDPDSRYFESLLVSLDRISASNNLYYGAGSGPAWDTNHVDGNPQFVDLTSRNFHLQENSPAIDAGVNVGIFTDYDGVTRPQGSGYDIGAYEFVSPTIRGDVNGDGLVNVVDVQLAVNQFLGITPQTQEADLNSDGVVNVIDVQLVVNIILSLAT